MAYTDASLRVLVAPDALPGFWIWMYRISPFNYLVSGMLSVAVADTAVVCADNEFLRFEPANGMSCLAYMEPYINDVGGYLEDSDSTSPCTFCPQSSTNKFLASVGANYADAWRNFGIMWAYIVFNIVGAVFIYWVARVPKNKKSEKA